MSAPPPPPTLPSPSAIFETAADSVSGISIHSAAERQHSLKKVDGSKVWLELAFIGQTIEQQSVVRRRDVSTTHSEAAVVGKCGGGLKALRQRELR